MKVVTNMPICPAGTIPYTIRSGDTMLQIAKLHHTTIHAIMMLNPGLDMNHLSVGQTICIRPEHGYHAPGAQPIHEGISKAELHLNNHLRMLWEQHVFWTRLVLLSIAHDLPDLELVSNRLLQNPKHFEAALKPFYGDAVAAKFAELLTEHLTIAAELVKAAKANDSRKATDAERRWYANADEIAAFLASINPHWSENEWRRMLHDHLAMTKTEAVDLLTHNDADSISIVDKIEQEALQMADIMTQGIVKQFPNRF